MNHQKFREIESSAVLALKPIVSQRHERQKMPKKMLSETLKRRRNFSIVWFQLVADFENTYSDLVKDERIT